MEAGTDDKLVQSIFLNSKVKVDKLRTSIQEKQATLSRLKAGPSVGQRNASDFVTLSVKVPAGYGPGSPITVRTPNGQEVQVTVPGGATAGST
eukprot:CAMPEP_0185790330 /NCGR_PEP_ID=MMETSP1174-20130828/155632_1 /TAXON_ID=35687 /ORGANISM="Dictyocha speculum, Strain CCMP1381" /LENGTH=92 /DNA_ID=CAMNT_0028484949 /DNA_START=33 /DNA_END=308 /DNA_ORIENTATION=+